jgi:MFS family permease
LASSVFISWAIGNFICSLVTDKVGRLWPLKISSIGVLVGGILCSFAGDYWELLLWRVVVCVFIGISTPIFTPLLSEIAPAKNRGKRYVIMNSGFIVGEIITIGIAYYCLDSINTGDWRQMIFLSACVILLPFFGIWCWGYESPRFLLLKGLYNEAFEILDKIGSENS